MEEAIQRSMAVGKPSPYTVSELKVIQVSIQAKQKRAGEPARLVAGCEFQNDATWPLRSSDIGWPD